MPDDGYISLQILNAEGQVVRQLLNQAWLTKGEHEVKWDGLTTLQLSHAGPSRAAGHLHGARRSGTKASASACAAGPATAATPRGTPARRRTGAATTACPALRRRRRQGLPGLERRRGGQGPPGLRPARQRAVEEQPPGHGRGRVRGRRRRPVYAVNWGARTPTTSIACTPPTAHTRATPTIRPTSCSSQVFGQSRRRPPASRAWPLATASSI